MRVTCSLSGVPNSTIPLLMSSIATDVRSFSLFTEQYRVLGPNLNTYDGMVFSLRIAGTSPLEERKKFVWVDPCACMLHAHTSPIKREKVVFIAKYGKSCKTNRTKY